MSQDDAVRRLYDLSVKIPLFWEADALFCRATENSVYRRQAIAALHLAPTATVLDAACGTGLNFKLLQDYLAPEGRLVGVDLSPGVLDKAGQRVRKQGWSNVELVNASLSDFDTELRFDAALCTFALSIIPDYRGALDRIAALLKPGGRFGVVGLQLSRQPFYRLLNPLWRLMGRASGGHPDRDVPAAIGARFADVERHDCFGGFYYILSASNTT